MAKVQFDRHYVVQKSTDLFWRQGFNGASMQEVVQVTGLKPGSLYLAFGNKEGLFREAIEQYFVSSLQAIQHQLTTAPSIGEGICQILQKMVLESCEQDYCSCFIIKSQLELAAKNADLYAFTTQKLCQTEALYADYLQQDYTPELAKLRATSLMMHIFGLRVYGYQDASIDKLVHSLQTGLPWLPWQTLSH